jgi:hypothetical protein
LTLSRTGSRSKLEQSDQVVAPARVGDVLAQFNHGAAFRAKGGSCNGGLAGGGSCRQDVQDHGCKQCRKNDFHGDQKFDEYVLADW